MLTANYIKLVDELVHTKKSFFIPSIMLNDPFIMEWYKTTSALVNHPNNWNNQHLATSICGFDDILAKTSANMATMPKNQPPLIKQFLAYMNDVVVVAGLLKVARTPGPKEYCNQPKGKHIQDSINLKDLDNFFFWSEQLSKLQSSLCTPYW